MKSCFSRVPQGLVVLDGTLSPDSLALPGVVAAGSEGDPEILTCSMEVCSSAVSIKHSSRGAYLQSLERSSRDWVLSSGKAPGMEEPATSSSAELKASVVICSSEGKIWYNPIPEDEDLQPPYPGRTKGNNAGNKEARNWKYREVEAGQEGTVARGSQPSSPGQSKPATRTEVWSGHQEQACGEH